MADDDNSGFLLVTNWAAISGKWDFGDLEVAYEGPDPEAPLPVGMALMANPFRDGSLRTTITLGRNERTTGGLVVGYQSENAPYVAAQLGAYDRAYVFSIFLPGVGWRSAAAAGLLQNLHANHPYAVELELIGQTLSLAVDGVRVLTATIQTPLPGTGAGLFAWDDGAITFGRTQIRSARPKIFVIMPFAEPYDTLYREVIDPVSVSMGFEVIRIDEVYGPGIIIDDIQRQIAGAHAVVAEISSRNPNVFYELGYAHALAKPAVLLVRRDQTGEIPFDIRGYRAIFYDDSIGGKRVVERMLKQHLEAVLHRR